jgi:Flp pilus assembly protein TadB
VTPRQIYIITLLTSCVPFVLLWAIPPTLVAITALPFVPMLHAMRRRIDRERAEIAEARDMPHAIAVRARRGA